MLSRINTKKLQLKESMIEPSVFEEGFDTHVDTRESEEDNFEGGDKTKAEISKLLAKGVQKAMKVDPTDTTIYGLEQLKEHDNIF